MASSMIHLAIAKRVNSVIKKDQNKLFIGSIAPDISKLIGENKVKSHFLDDEYTNIPNLEKFLNKYKNNLNDDFVLGYYIHLLTDYLWFKYFITNFWDDNFVTKLDGTKVKCTDRMLLLYIYNDYTNMNIKIIDEYNIDLKMFYLEIPVLDNIITEIPMDKIRILIDNVSRIIENSKINKDMVFNIDNVKKFIDFSSKIIIDKLKEFSIC